MTVTIGSFDRAPGEALARALVREAADDGWWRDVLRSPDYIVALRRNAANVYWQGQSIYRVVEKGGRLEATTHAKYLPDISTMTAQIRFDGLKFAIEGLHFVDQYVGQVTTENLRDNAGKFSGGEKIGCHLIAQANSLKLLDLEIALPGSIQSEMPGETRNTPRIDLLVLEPAGDGWRLEFWEAKHFTNKELRSRKARGTDALTRDSVPVLRQLDDYNRILSDYGSAIRDSYARVCRVMTEIRLAAGLEVGPAIAAIADDPLRLVASQPVVNLLIFGFDAAQRDHPVWKEDREKLKKAVESESHGGRLRAVGNPKGARL